MRIAVAEGRLQAMAILWAEGEPSIVSLCEQPLRIHSATRSAPFMTLDLSVKHANGQEVIYAIRPTRCLIARDDGRVFPEHWEAIEAWGNHNGIHFDVLTDDRLDRDKIRIANWRALLGFVRQARENPAPELEAELLSIIQAHAGIPVTSLADHVTGCDEQTLVAHVANLLHQGRMDAQLSTIPFNRYSPLTVSTHA